MKFYRRHTSEKAISARKNNRIIALERWFAKEQLLKKENAIWIDEIPLSFKKNEKTSIFK